MVQDQAYKGLGKLMISKPVQVVGCRRNDWLFDFWGRHLLISVKQMMKCVR